MIYLGHIFTDPEEIYINPEHILLDMEGKGDLINTFPIPDCEECVDKCCPSRLELSLLDIARFIDLELDKFILGTFEHYIACFSMKIRRATYKKLERLHVVLSH